MNVQKRFIDKRVKVESEREQLFESGDARETGFGRHLLSVGKARVPHAVYDRHVFLDSRPLEGEDLVDIVVPVG